MDEMYSFEKMGSRRTILVGIAIATGVFLAYEFNARWQDRQSGLEEQNMLDALNVEFTSIHAALTQHLTKHMRTLESLEDLLATIENGSSKNTAPIIDSALLEMTDLDTWDRDDSTLNSLLSSDRTRILSSGNLRAKLEAWDGVIGEYWGDQEIANRMVDETHIPYFASMNISVPVAMSESEGGQPALERSASNNADAIRRLLEDPKFHVLAATRYRFKEHLIVEIEIAITAAEAITAEIEKPLN